MNKLAAIRLFVAALAAAVCGRASAEPANINSNTIVVAPAPTPRERGPACWHDYVVSSYDDPKTTRNVRVWQCEPIGSDGE